MLKINKIKKAIKSLIAVVFFLSLPLLMIAQTPPHPNGGSASGSGNTPFGGGVPVGGGILLMIALGIG